ncbi:MAG: TIM barrel protein [Bryobacterales bacterium]|nr:TIM barrel protein [Bryobacterales bacterium]
MPQPQPPPQSGIPRRAILAAASLAALSSAPAVAALPAGPRLSVRVEPLFPNLTLPEQLERVAEAGYQGFEFGDWRAQDAATITALKNRLGLTCVCLVGNRGVNPVGMGLCDPSEREGFLAEIRSSLEAARRFESGKLVVLSGFKVKRLTRAQQHASIVEGLKRAAELAALAKVTLIVEPINTLARVEPLNPTGNNHADYFLDKTAEAAEIMHEVDSPFVRILYDLYHAQIMDGNLTETIREHHALIAHIHVGDVPGRHEPGTGEIHFANVFRAIFETRFAGFIGMEYIPSIDAMKTLAAVKAMADAAFRTASH